MLVVFMYSPHVRHAKTLQAFAILLFLRGRFDESREMFIKAISVYRMLDSLEALHQQASSCCMCDTHLCFSDFIHGSFLQSPSGFNKMTTALLHCQRNLLRMLQASGSYVEADLTADQLLDICLSVSKLGAGSTGGCESGVRTPPAVLDGSSVRTNVTHTAIADSVLEFFLGKCLCSCIDVLSPFFGSLHLSQVLRLRGHQFEFLMVRLLRPPFHSFISRKQ